jgi:hypothetical protein
MRNERGRVSCYTRQLLGNGINYMQARSLYRGICEPHFTLAAVVQVRSCRLRQGEMGFGKS